MLLASTEAQCIRAKMGLPPNVPPHLQIPDLISAAEQAERELYNYVKLFDVGDVAASTWRRLIKEPNYFSQRRPPMDPLAKLRASVAVPPGLESQMPRYAAMDVIKETDPFLTEEQAAAPDTPPPEPIRRGKAPKPALEQTPEPEPLQQKSYQITLLLLDRDRILLQENEQPPRGLFDITRPYPEALSDLLARTGHQLVEQVPTLP